VKKEVKRITASTAKPVVNKNLLATKIVIEKNVNKSHLEVVAYNATGLDILQAIQALTKLYSQDYLKPYDYDYKVIDYL
jgi:hypothetical protein